MEGIPPAPRGVPQIEVTFAIDSNGIVNVSSRDMATNQSQSIQITPSGGLSKNEVERLVDEARAHASDDADRRELRRHKNRLEGLIYTCDRVFEQLREGMEGQEQKKIAQIVLKARMSLSQDVKSDIEAAIFDLNTISHRLSELMLEQTTKAKEKEAKEKDKGKKDKDKDKDKEKGKEKA